MCTLVIDLDQTDVATVGTWLPEDEDGPLGDPTMITVDVPQTAVTLAAALRLADGIVAAVNRAAGI